MQHSRAADEGFSLKPRLGVTCRLLVRLISIPAPCGARSRISMGVSQWNPPPNKLSAVPHVRARVVVSRWHCKPQTPEFCEALAEGLPARPSRLFSRRVELLITQRSVLG